ncbi:MAG: hypothetical protein JWR34_2492 [Mycobacterium sp.]|nr:hypothetical protein [Mycobacterium sp.]
MAEEQDRPITRVDESVGGRVRVIDGQRPWGSIDTGVSRQGFRRYRLVVFPPGISDFERRLLRLWHRWPVWGATLWLVTVIPFVGTPNASMAVVTATALYLGSGATLFAMLGPVRTRVLVMSVVLISGYPDPVAAAAYTELKAVAIILCAADTLRDEGDITPAQHEALWWQAYDRLGRNERVRGTTVDRKGTDG